MNLLVLVPIYNGDFKYSRKIYRSYLKKINCKNVDFKFILSPDDDEILLNKKYKVDMKNIWKIDLDINQFKSMLNYSLSTRGSIINLKKFLALKKFVNEYEYIFIADCESKFVNVKKSIIDLCEMFFEKKILLTNNVYYVNAINEIINECLKFFHFPSSNHKEKYFNNYLWFNNPCIYKKDITLKFLDYMEKVDKNWLLNLSFFTFDYYLYMIFLLEYSDFKMVDLKTKNFYSTLEEQYLFRILKYRKNFIENNIYIYIVNQFVFFVN